MTSPGQERSFVGRQTELDALAHLLAPQVDRPPIAVVEGPAGIGKTTFVEEFLGSFPGSVVRAIAAPWESEHRYAVLDQLGVPAEAGSDPLEQATALCSVLQGPGLQPQVAEQPVMVVVDGAEWADPESLMALHSATRRAPWLRVILTARTAIRTALPHLHRLQLSELTTKDVRQIAHRAEVSLTEREARVLRDHARGAPGPLLELLAEAPATVWRDPWGVLPATRTHAGRVRDALATCTGPGQALVRAAAVLGDGCRLDVAIRLAEIDEPVAAIDSAAAAGLLREELRLGLPVLRFPEPMTRSAVLEASEVRHTHDLHRRAAELVDDDLRVLWHRLCANPGSPGTLRDELLDFAARRAGEGAWIQVASALVRASRLEPDRARSTQLLVDGVDALVGAGNLPEANLFVEELAGTPRSARVDSTLAYLSILRGRPAEAELLLDRSWQERGTSSPEVRALVSARWCLHQLAQWHPQGLVDWSDRAIALGRADTPAELEAAAMRGIGLAACGRWDEALAGYAELAARVTSGPQAQRIRMGRGWINLARDEPLSARHDFEGAVPTRFRMGSVRISLWAQGWLARTLFQLGDWDEALAVVARASHEVAESEHELIRPLVHWTGVQVNALRGDTAAAQEHLRLGAASAQHYPIMRIPAALAQAQLAEAAADYEGVIRALAPVNALLAPQHEPGFWPWPGLLTNALVMTDRTAEAEVLLAEHQALATARGHRSSQAALEAVRGRMLCARGDLDAGTASFESALALLADLPFPYERARVNFSYGQSLRRAGRRREADPFLRAAREAYLALGATTYVVRSERELKASGLHARRAGGATELTPQESAVADLVAGGLSNREVAEQLYVSVKTVQFHLTRIYAKLGIRSRTQLAAQNRPRTPKDET